MNRKLVLYSDQMIPETAAIDQRMLSLIGKDYPTIGYMPSSSDPEHFFFNQIWAYYAALGASVEIYLELDMSFSEETLPALLSCDAIHLSGGNTFYFLRGLKQRAMPPVLRDYVARGGVLIGVSAGAILMTPNISSAALCGDETVEGLNDLSALSLVDFQFLPHFQPDKACALEVAAHQSQVHSPLYACPDGGGIVVDGTNVEFFGAVQKFENGLL